jgi:trans-AT polyketide synthase/acyltransferase/oxidoreductase domain-containing protein
MGAGLFDRYADWTAAADEVLGYSIRELCLDDSEGRLGLTAFTQPALFVVNAMSYRARQDEGKPVPDYAAGHSLGEYNALLAAGVFDFASGMRMVHRRGQLMAEVGGGGMMAVLGLDPEAIARVLSDSEAGRAVDVANFNSFDQTVIAGPKPALEAVKAPLEQAGAVKVILLNVSAPFHSRYMRDVEREFTGFLESFAFAPPAIPVISNVTGEPYDRSALRETLARQIGHSVRWLDSVRYLLRQGVTEFEEVGPGSVLKKLVAQIRKRAPM